VTNISRSFYLQDGGKNRLKQNYVTVTLCIDGCCSWYCYKAVERLVQCRTVAFGSARVSLSQNMRTCLFVLRRAAASHLSTLHYKLSSQCPPRTHTQCTLANNLLCHGSTRLELPCCSMEIENWSMIWSIVCYVTIYFKSMLLTCSLFLTFYLCCCSSEPSCLQSGLGSQLLFPGKKSEVPSLWNLIYKWWITDDLCRRRGQLCLSRQTLRYTALGIRCAPLLQCLGLLSLQPFVGR